MATINYNNGNVNVSFFPTNVNPIWFCDKNTGGINIATNGAAMTANTLQLGNAATTTILSGAVNASNVDSIGVTNNLDLGRSQTTGTITIGDASSRTGPIYVGNRTAGSISIGTAMTGANYITMGTVTNTSTQIRGKSIEIGDNGGNVFIGKSDTNTIVNGVTNLNPKSRVIANTTGNIVNSGSAQNGIYQIQATPAFRIEDTGYTFNGITGMSLKMGIYRDTGRAYIQCEQSSIGDRAICLQPWNGNVGIATVDPTHKLDVNGTARFFDNLNLHTNSGISNNTRITMWATFYNFPGDQSPRRACDIVCGYRTSTWNTEYLAFKVGGSDDTNKDTTERMCITGLGRVGIGTTDPQYLLDVNGNAALCDNLVIQPGSFTRNAKAKITMYSSFDDTSGDYTKRRAGDIICGYRNGGWQNEYMSFNVGRLDGGLETTDTVERMCIRGIGAAGRVGIGTSTPAYTLDVNGEARIGNWNTNGYFMGTSTVYPNFALYQVPSLTVLNSPTEIRLNIGDSQKMTVNSAGYVGIGTASPAYKLDVDGNAKIGSIIINGANLGASGTYDPGSTIGSTKYALYQDTNTCLNGVSALLFNILGVTKMALSATGYLGIGTTTPEHPLHVVGGPYRKNTDAANNYLTDAGINGGEAISKNSGPNFAYKVNLETSIYATKTIWSAEGFVASSDRRIKTNIIDIQDDVALQLFRRLQPKLYGYKDVVQKGNETVYGFIAQEVREVLPLAAKISTSTVPNIYTISTVVGDLLTFDTSKLEYDASGQLFKKLKLIKEDNSEFFVQILSVTETGVQIDQTLTEDKVFVYGQEVDNFHTLNKDAIWTVATAALQEVDRQLQAEKSKTAVLEQKCLTLEAKYDSLQSNYEALLARIVALESKG